MVGEHTSQVGLFSVSICRSLSKNYILQVSQEDDVYAILPIVLAMTEAQYPYVFRYVR